MGTIKGNYDFFENAFPKKSRNTIKGYHVGVSDYKEKFQSQKLQAMGRC